MHVSDRVREACAWVAGRARSVAIDEEAIASYVSTLPVRAEEAPQPDPATHVVEGDLETRAAFVICLNAINFGSGWWPTIRKRPGHSGYFTIAAGLAERFRATGPWSADALTRLSASDIAGTVGQEHDHPLMADYATALRDVGERARRPLPGRRGGGAWLGAGAGRSPGEMDGVRGRVHVCGCVHA
jgi:hypothetical protein